MNPAVYDTIGIWKHWKLITTALAVLFVIAVAADVVLWYSLQKSNAAAETLNDIIARQPPAPKTDEDKIKLLDSLAAAHAAAIAQIEARHGKSKTAVPPVEKPTPVPAGSTAPSPSDPVVQAKIRLLDSFRK